MSFLKYDLTLSEVREHYQEWFYRLLNPVLFVTNDIINSGLFESEENK